MRMKIKTIFVVANTVVKKKGAKNGEKVCKITYSKKSFLRQIAW